MNSSTAFAAAWTLSLETLAAATLDAASDRSVFKGVINDEPGARMALKCLAHKFPLSAMTIVATEDLINAGDARVFSILRKSPSNEHLDVAIGRLGENISEALVVASKTKFKLPPDIHSKIRHRNKIRRFWQRSRDPALKNVNSLLYQQRDSQ
ncbi:hypothetical protein TNCV_3939531 [Trichonephila clavipes]|uniref:Uncharacterized protein n=1 Tax=Trichonephila clavipes TaxID=2585209 RepID=A0A8X6VVF2_TRICX|nr:hypothetical protein TNCV_3939531 [Trichonephila clavipes]